MKKIEFMDLFISELDYALGVLTRKVKKMSQLMTLWINQNKKNQ